MNFQKYVLLAFVVAAATFGAVFGQGPPSGKPPGGPGGPPPHWSTTPASG